MHIIIVRSSLYDSFSQKNSKYHFPYLCLEFISYRFMAVGYVWWREEDELAREHENESIQLDEILAYNELKTANHPELWEHDGFAIIKSQKTFLKCNSN